jgi:hypothetical protein
MNRPILAAAVFFLLCADSQGASAMRAAREQATTSCQMIFSDPTDGIGVVQPGPFAFVQDDLATFGAARFHLFYTRRLRRMPTDQDMAHATSSDFAQWTIVDTSVVFARAHHFDEAHVSAPTIVKAVDGWVMLYGATDAQGRESIGLARSFDLDRWEQEDRPVLETRDVPWALRGAGASAKHRAILRDPFVMPDPAVPGGWILFFVAVPATRPDGTVVGYARSRGDLHAWTASAPLWNTFRPGRDEVEVASPHAFFRAGAWRLFTTVDHAGPPIPPRTPGGVLIPPDSVFVHSNAASPIDTTLTRWSSPQALQFASTASTMYNFFQHTECLEVAPGVQILAGVSPPVSGIAYSLMADAPPPAFFAADCPILPASVHQSSADQRSGLAADAASHSMRLELPPGERGTLAVYDVRGRLIRTVFTGMFSSGESRWAWDGRDDAGRAVPRGVYFAQVRTQARREALRILLWP